MTKNPNNLVTKKQIWNTLSKVNVNNHTEKVGKFTYLSWTWAIDTLMAHYPSSSWKFLDDLEHGDGSKEVRVELTIDENVYSMWLAVMDYKNKAIPNPVSTEVANARMRCLTKAIAVAGLGFYIYQGEDLPKASEENSLAGKQSTSNSASPKSKKNDTKTSQRNVYSKLVPFGKLKGKKYGEAFSEPEFLAKAIKHWETHWENNSKVAREDAILHLGTLKELQDSNVKGVL